MLVGRRASRAVVDKDLLVGAQDPEDVIVINDRLRPAQEEIAAVVEGHVEDGKEIPLQDILEIDQEISAADQVQPAEGRILKDIVLGEDDHLADVVIDHIAVALFGKETAQPRDRDILQNAVAVDAARRHVDGIAVQVRREDLDIPAQSQLIHGLREEDGDRIGLLTCGTAGHPDPDLVRCPVAPEQVLDDPLLENVKIIRVAEEGGDSDQDLLGQQPDLLRIVVHVVDIFLQVAVVGDHDPSLDPAQDGRLLVIGIVYVCDFLQYAEDLGHEVPVRELQAPARVRDRPGDMGHLAGDAVRVQDQVREAGRDRAPGHAVKLGALRRLDDDQAVPVLDRPDPVCPVRSRS